MLIIKDLSRRHYSPSNRDYLGTNALDRQTVLKHAANIEKFIKIYERHRNQSQKIKKLLKLSIALEYVQILKVLIVEMPRPPPRQVYAPRTFESMATFLRESNFGFSELFRFQDVNKLTRFKICFRFPAGLVTVGAKQYTMASEEIILISLLRLSYPMQWSKLCAYFPGKQRWSLQHAFYWFMDFMITNWGYLLLNNMEYWKPHLASSAEAIRLKLANLNWQSWRQHHPSAFEENGFNIFGFIDNTMFAFCRPGGNTDEGAAAPRVPLEVQQAWWNGWKKLHGMKWQSITLANGMDFNVFGPLSVRRNDLKALNRSKMLAKLAMLQEDVQLAHRKKIFGDSAYHESTYIAVNGGRGMASVRETIEWSYKDVKEQWKYCDYNIVLKLRKQPVAKILFVCLLLRNEYVTLHSGQIGEYLGMMPPTLEDWCSQGPKARLIPTDTIFSPDYHADSDSDVDSDVEE